MIFIYLDVYFFLSLALDYISLYVSCAVFAYKPTFSRLFLASLSAAFLSCVLLFTKSFLTTNIILFLLSFPLCAVAVGRYDIRVFLFFVFCEFFLGGICSFLEGMLSGEAFVKLGFFVLIVTSALIMPIFALIQKKAKKVIECDRVLATLEIKGAVVEISLMIDSGNLAREAITNRRIIFLGARTWEIILKKTTASGMPASFAVFLKTASGKKTMSAYMPDKITFENEKYNSENFLVLPCDSCRDFAGFDGIVPLIK